MPTSKPKEIKYRSEDFLKMDSLFYLADQVGMGVMSFQTNGDFFIEYFKAVGHRPEIQECRDEIDYQLRFDAWLKGSTVRSPHYPSFHEMILGEIKRLKELPL